MNVDYASRDLCTLDCLGWHVGEVPADDRAQQPDEIARAVSASADAAATVGAKLEFRQIMNFRNTNPVLAPALEEAAV